MRSVRDTLESVLTRLDERSSDERVFLQIYREAARAAADAADARRRAGVPLGPLDGVIVSIKDLFDVAGETTTAGSIVLRDAAPAQRDATVVRRLRQAGAVVVGKTNMVEFAFAAIGLNPHYGTPRQCDRFVAHPRRLLVRRRGIGGGGHERRLDRKRYRRFGSIPAALNGIVGFKPTAKRVPLEGVFPLSYSLDSVGPLAGSVQDCVNADAIMAGEEPGEIKPLSLAGLRIGIPRGRLFGDTEPLVAEAFEANLTKLSRAGARIVDHDIEDLLQGMAEATSPASIASTEAAEIHADWLDSKASLFDPRVRQRIALSAGVSAPVYIRMMRKRVALAAAMADALAPIDVLALPTTPRDRAENRTFGRRRRPLFPNEPAPLAQHHGRQPVRPRQRLAPAPGCERPVGFMLVAPHGHDRKLLAVAASIETLLCGSR